MGLDRAVNRCHELVKVYLLIQLQKVRNVVNRGAHIGRTFNEDSFLRIGKRVVFLYFSLCFLTGSLNKAL